MNSLEKLVYMANQIAINFGALGEAEAISSVAVHIHDFWDPHMKSLIFAHLDAGGEGLHPVAHAALSRLAKDTGHIAA